MHFALELGHAFFQIGNLVVRHRGDLDVARRGQLAIVIQLLARVFQFVPFRQHSFDARVLAHDFAGALAIVEKLRVGDLAFELLEPLAFALNERIKVHGHYSRGR